MPNTFKPKRSNTPSSVPTTGNLADGELAVNSADKIIYLRDGGSIVEVANYSTGTGGESYWIQNDVGIHTLSNIGIGTTNPTYKVQIDDTAATGAGLLVRGGGAGTQLARFERNVGSTGSLIDIIASSSNQQISFVGSTINTFTVGVNISSYSGSFEIADSNNIGTNTRFLINPIGDVGIGTTNPTSKLDVLGDVKISGITTSNVFVSSGGIYSAPGETKSDAAFVMGQNDAIYTLDSNQFLRVLIEKQSGTIIIGQSGTAFINGIELRPGGSGSVKLHHGGSGDNVKIQTTGVGATVFGDLEVSGNINSAGIITASNLTEYKILDDISSSFDGVTTQFTISSSSVNFLNSEITTAARLLISVGGIVQQPDPTQTNGFYISGGTDLSTDPIKINFLEAPKVGQIFFGVAFGLTATPSTSFLTAEQSIAYSIVFGV